mmetsp:Transcript_9369/g.16957  ORF Transcript_9369/g.16957 Transcript_9369/m.16957 type:complete len:496 (-) Transcript_9369:132-1619(-)
MARALVVFTLLLQLSNTCATIQSGQLTAGDIDDNLNFDWYRRYVNRYRLNQQQTTQFPSPYSDLTVRIVVDIVDSDGEPFSCAAVEIVDAESATTELPAGTNGLLQIFPLLDSLTYPLSIRAKTPGGSCPGDCGAAVEVTQNNSTVSLSLATASTPPSQLDVAFVVDTTGSMGDELAYLQAELSDVFAAVHARYQGVSTQLGVVLFKDHGDVYVTQRTDLTADVEDAIAKLQLASGGGGGDYPEAMKEALEETNMLQWRTGNTARVAFVVADAPPHTEQLDATILQVMELRRQGVKVYGLAGSGVGDLAEYMMRLMAVITGARHLWLTDDSGIGFSHQEPKVLCYKVTRLDQLLIRVLNSELQGHRIEAEAHQIIREVGHQEEGVCLLDFQPATTPTTTSSTASTSSTGTTGTTVSTQSTATTAEDAVDLTTTADHIFEGIGDGDGDGGEEGKDGYEDDGEGLISGEDRDAIDGCMQCGAAVLTILLAGFAMWSV